MVYAMVCMHALWLQVCGAVNDKSTNSYTTRGTMAQLELQVINPKKHNTILAYH